MAPGQQPAADALGQRKLLGLCPRREPAQLAGKYADFIFWDLDGKVRLIVELAAYNPSDPKVRSRENVKERAARDAGGPRMLISADQPAQMIWRMISVRLDQQENPCD